MSQSEINPTLSRIINLFKLFGIWSKSEDNSEHRKVWKFGHTLNNMLFLITLLAFAFIADDRNEAIFLVLIHIIAFVIFLKMIYLLSKKEEILSLLSDSRIDASVLDSDGKQLVIEKKRIFTKIVDVYIINTRVGVAIVIASAFPIFTTGMKLPFYITYSFDWEYDAVVYWMIYIFMSWSSILAIAYNLFLIFVWYILYNYSTQYQLLGMQFKNLGTTRNSCFIRDLISLIKIHRNLYE